MKKMKAFFVSEDGFLHTLVAEAVLLGTKSEELFNGHVAIWFEEVIDEATSRILKSVIFEAHRPKAEFSLDGDKYNDDKNKYTFEFEVEDEVYLKAVNMALRLEGRPYGLSSDCLATLVKEQCGKDISKYINCDDTVICSEVFARIIQAMFKKYLEGENLNIISPKKAYHSFMEFICTEPRIKLISAIEG